MDAREGHSQNKCGMWGQKSHNKKTCKMDNVCELVETTLRAPGAASRDGAIGRC